jgi:alpha-L-fucosidase 2
MVFNAVRVSVLLFSLFSTLMMGQSSKDELQPGRHQNLSFEELATTWDEGIPLGNGMLGALIWEKEGKLRFSLDRADLWDLRPTANLDNKNWTFKWVIDRWKNNQYQEVQQMFDLPYDRDPGPSKIPAGALEFNILAKVKRVELILRKGLCEVEWANGMKMETFVHATKQEGWFKFSGIKENILPSIVPPPYHLSAQSGEDNPVTGQDLRRLGYPAGDLTVEKEFISYTQEGWNGFTYRIKVQWKSEGDVLIGHWNIQVIEENTADELPTALSREQISTESYNNVLNNHKNWWLDYWKQCSIDIPDSILLKQWYLEQYKFGAANGNGAPPISLQAVWTADNGKLPPWKGDFHNDLNTQLSYWPAYSANKLGQSMGFIDWLEKNKPVFESYTKQYFQTNGVNVPGVSTFAGSPMGGWIQYSFGPTVSAWIAHHYYLQWRYSMDRTFLSEKAYPWLEKVAIYLMEVSLLDEKGIRKLPLSSSPEIFNNSRQAWFSTMTNFDLGLVKWLFSKTSELAIELNKPEDAVKWKQIEGEWGELDVDDSSGLTFAKDFLYDASHRHFSHLVAFHPLGLVDVSKGEKDKQIIQNTINTLDKYGSSQYCGYSFSWLGNLKARNMDGVGAAEALRIFASHFCLKNSFHANGDQSKLGYSTFTYRPFTLEGNFAFAAGLQEMLLQSHAGFIHLFPAIPPSWKTVSFHKMRTEGAFLVSANLSGGKVEKVQIEATVSGVLKIKNPFEQHSFKSSISFIKEGEMLVFNLSKGDILTLNL